MKIVVTYLNLKFVISLGVGNSSGEDGTFFLHEYMILRKSKSFCLYDTRGLSNDPSDNIEMLKQWMSKGVHHGKLVTRLRF